MNVRMHICISKIHISDLIYFKIEIADAKRSLGGKKIDDEMRGKLTPLFQADVVNLYEPTQLFHQLVATISGIGTWKSVSPAPDDNDLLRASARERRR